MFAYHVYITTKVSEYGFDLEIKGQSQIFLKTVTLLIVQTPLWCIHGMGFSTTIAYDVQIKTKVSDSWYDLVVKGQGHTHLELVYGLNANSSFIFDSM